MKMKAEQPQQAVSATGADTPSIVLEASLIEATPNAADAATYASLATIEEDDDIVRWYPLLIWHSNPKKARRREKSPGLRSPGSAVRDRPGPGGDRRFCHGRRLIRR